VTAAPTSRSTGYVDGSLYANNPTLEVLREVAGLHSTGVDAINVLVSIGTKQQDARRNPGLFSHKRSLLKALNRPTDFVHERMLKELQDEEEEKYFRIEVEGEYNDRLEGKKGLEQLRRNVMGFLNEMQGKEKLARLAQKLVARRKKRANTPAWESFASNVTYQCLKSKDPACKATFDRLDLLRHWISVHNYDYPDPSNVAQIALELDRSRRDIAIS
jgi:hypothetical protein